MPILTTSERRWTRAESACGRSNADASSVFLLSQNTRDWRELALSLVGPTSDLILSRARPLLLASRGGTRRRAEQLAPASSSSPAVAPSSSSKPATPSSLPPPAPPPPAARPPSRGEARPRQRRRLEASSLNPAGGPVQGRRISSFRPPPLLPSSYLPPPASRTRRAAPPRSASHRPRQQRLADLPRRARRHRMLMRAGRGRARPTVRQRARSGVRCDADRSVWIKNRTCNGAGLVGRQWSDS